MFDKMYEKFKKDCCKCNDVECKLTQANVLNVLWKKLIEKITSNMKGD